MRRAVVILAIALGAGAAPASAHELRGTFRVDISVAVTRASSSCMLHWLAGWSGTVARVSCLTAEVPSFAATGWPAPDAGAMAITAAPHGVAKDAERRRGPSIDGRAMHSATIQTPQGPDSLREIEVSF